MNAIRANGPWPVMIHGGVGCGKTCAAGCIYREWRRSRERAGTARWFRLDNLIDFILKARFSNEGIVTYLPTGDAVRQTEGGLFAAFEQADFVVLDDFGVTEFNPQREEVSSRLIESRVGKPLIVTANYSPSEFTAKGVDDRLVSRLSAGTVIHATGDDRRLQNSRFVEA